MAIRLEQEVKVTDIIQDDQRTIDSSNGIVTDAWLDRHHPFVEYGGSHVGGFVWVYPSSSTQVAGR